MLTRGSLLTLRVSVGICLGLLGATVALSLPGSPRALDRADAVMAAGDASGALEHYAAVARWGWTPTLRAHAAFRAAIVEATALDQSEAAAARLARFVLQTDHEALAVEALAALGGVYSVSDHTVLPAAVAFERAARQAPDDPRVAQWYGSASVARERAGDPEGALRDLGHLVALGGLDAVDGWLGIGRLRFELGDMAGAYDAFRNGASLSPDPGRSRLIRLAMAHALERLGDVNAAVAELDATEARLSADSRFAAARVRMLARVEARLDSKRHATSN